jgi:hypothetical protein
MRLRYLAVGLLPLALGCGKPYELAPVSGRVTLNGKPLAKAWVHFAPAASKGNDSPGPTAHGETDADGRFKLIVDPDHPGAVVGRHRVFISTLELARRPGGDVPDAGAKAGRDKVPARYNQETKLTFEVPAAGTDAANFDLAAP